jgi:arylformamidase
MLIDLSVPLNADTPVYPGDPKTEIMEAGIISKDGYKDHYFCVGTHVGTHIDAPSHMLPGGDNLDGFPLEHFAGNGVYVDVRQGFDFEKIKEAPIQKGDIVLFHTGFGDAYYEPRYYENYPGIPEKVADLLVAKKVKMVGMDMCSPDHPPFPIHKILLQNRILIMENLTNIGQLEGKKFRVHAYPVKLEIDAAPVRAVAEILQ